MYTERVIIMTDVLYIILYTYTIILVYTILCYTIHILYYSYNN